MALPQVRTHYPPMLTQYLEYKAQYPDCLLLCQVGDFYEVFFEDAITVSQVLHLTLTSRDKNDTNPIPMCGVPISVVDTYADRLVNRGFSVAIVSQVGEVPAKGMVQRKLDRIITPGIRVLGSTGGAAGPVVALYLDEQFRGAISFGDVESGLISVSEAVGKESLLQELTRLLPSECIIVDRMGEKVLDRRSSWIREVEYVVRCSLKFRPESFASSHRFDAISGFSSIGDMGRKAVRLLLGYFDESTIDVSASISRVIMFQPEGVISIDAKTRENLDLVTNGRDGSERGTLYEVLHQTCSPGGSKLLKNWLTNPLGDIQRIEERLSVVEIFLQNESPLRSFREALQYAPDLERIASRISLQVVGPKELDALRTMLQRLPQLKGFLQEVFSSNLLVTALMKEMGIEEGLLTSLEAFLTENPPMILSQGGVVRREYDEELARLRGLSATGRSWMAEFEAQEKQRSGINSLKIKFNNVLGYFIEVPVAHGAKVPSDYIRRQSTANTERFLLPSLQEMAEQLLSADSKAIALEERLYKQFRISLLPYVECIRRIGGAISTLDVLQSFAVVAGREGYTRPRLESSESLCIEQGRHPVLSMLLKERFIANSLTLGTDSSCRCAILTGPNMGGKSTYLRQAALITIMAQIGSFVPAEKVTLGIVDKIFARLGASDNMMEGESTFMVEMREAANILLGATARSLVLIDEIGRGTTTADGIVLAQSILEWLVTQIGCRTIFATHFHELTALSEVHPSIGNFSVTSREEQGDVIFTHHIRAGAANKSYGLDVAKLAGLPPALLLRARSLLKKLELERSQNQSSQISLFSQVPDPIPSFAIPDPEQESMLAQYQQFVKEIQDVDTDRMTPLDALLYLNRLKQEVSL